MSQSFNLGKARFETVTEQQRRNPSWKPFDWCMDFDKYRTMGGRIIYGEALHPGVTRNFDEYTRREVELSARMLIGKPLEIDRHGNLMEAENVVLDAEPVGGNIQYIARVLDKNTVKRIDDEDIRWVSFNGMCRRTPDFIPGVEPRGCEGLLIFRLCLVGESSPLPPGDPQTSVHVWATIQKELQRMATMRQPSMKDARVVTQVKKRTQKRRVLSRREKQKFQAIVSATSGNARSEQAILRGIKRRQQEETIPEVKPQKDEDYMTFMERCRKAGYDEPTCEIKWCEAQPKLKGEERTETASFDKIETATKYPDAETAILAESMKKRLRGVR